MLTYLEIGDSPALRDRIEAHVDTSTYTAPSSKRRKWNRKKQHDLINTQQQAAASVNREVPSSGTKIIKM